MASLEMDPISLVVWQGQNLIVRKCAPSAVFADAMNVLPIAADEVSIFDYGNMINITDVMAILWNERPYRWKIVVRVFRTQLQNVLVGQTEPMRRVFYDIFAIVQDSQRPLSAVAPEMGHCAGRTHAVLGPADQPRDPTQLLATG
ncbi:uncharacterized protein Z518_00483 [Rhinocladiella mackenziei CBS 650.93]|uniref:Uncharacterized protein n=1 Tax=Rhinocladiella mackenziei CBS 650.93 TaxID=1442369 RepID=A0A0D2HFD0_9EURO|nr:uncharacterized protein Z518_00483 [Rhinocladiella mackenziei CBS 650.93]KIX09403.1 hypothetical protein Z518_00483 [Rhinocladiella mackenziei CBS 650.93]